MEHISNEEKAKHIANAFFIENVSAENELVIREMLKDASLEAMEWKEKEIKDRLTNVLYNHSLNGIIEGVKNRYFISLDEFTDFIVKGE